jgi:ornithine cyclodeaminase/alanine dehydrogenase
MSVSLPNQVLYLSTGDVSSIGLSMPEIIAALEGMFREKAEGRVEMPAKVGIHTMPDAFLHAMPAWIPSRRAAGMKWVGGYPGNQRRGFPYISGLLVLNDVETGIPIAIMDCTWITAQRTGAATAIAAKHLAQKDSETVGILGCGVQGRSNLEALIAVLPIKQVRAYDTNPACAADYLEGIRRKFGLKGEAVDDPRRAVEGCDIVVTAGPILRTPHATIQAGWLQEGAFASLVDFDSYWHAEALREVDKFCTDDIPQLEHYRSIGYFQGIPRIHADLASLVSSRTVGRERPNERTIACNLGLALEDIAIAALVYEKALERGVGCWLTL